MLRLHHCAAPLRIAIGDVRVDARALGGLRLGDTQPLRRIASELLLGGPPSKIELEALDTLALDAPRTSQRGLGTHGARPACAGVAAATAARERRTRGAAAQERLVDTATDSSCTAPA